MTTTEKPTPPVVALDLALLGELLINYTAVSNMLGHKKLSFTLKDYVDLDGASPEAAFLVAAVTRPIAEVITEWFGDRSVADAIVSNVVDGQDQLSDWR
jgi:hypothetical protein